MISHTPSRLDAKVTAATVPTSSNSENLRKSSGSTKVKAASMSSSASRRNDDTVTGGSNGASRLEAGERKALPACQQDEEKDQRRPEGGVGLNCGHGLEITGCI